MPMVPTPISQLTSATLPLSGTELIAVVQNGQTKKTTVVAAQGSAVLGAEVVRVLVAGNNNNIPVSSTTGRLLLDTTAGDATVTGFAAGLNGQLVQVTNTGPNNLVEAIENVLSLAANRLYGPFDITKPSKDSFFMCYSGTLSRWVIS